MKGDMGSRGKISLHLCIYVSRKNNIECFSGKHLHGYYIHKRRTFH